MIAEYLKAVDAGERPDREETLARHMDLEVELRRFFRAQDGMDKLMGGERSPVENVLGDHELIEEIGRGGMGVVYKARQKSLDRIVALKTILPDRMATSGAPRSFPAERLRAAARIRHHEHRSGVRGQLRGGGAVLLHGVRRRPFARSDRGASS